jgi:hypothetical protein
MSYQDLMAMPIRAFWLFSRNIYRIDATEQRSAVRVAVAAQSPEALTDLHNDIQRITADVVTSDITLENLDSSGLDDLRSMQ